MGTSRLSIFLVIGMLLGCSSNDEGPDTDNRLNVDMTAAVLTDFQLSEVQYVDIELTQPEIVDGAQTSPGQIMITTPAAFDSFELSLSSVNFDVSRFEISPAVGSVQTFGEGNTIEYTITSLQNRDLRISYMVTIIKEDVVTENPRITGFRFERSKNANLVSDIDALRIIEYPARNFSAIFVLVPLGTDLTDLVPTIEFEGSELQYRQGNSDFIPFPETDLGIDFTSDYNYVSFENTNQLQLMVTTPQTRHRYRVIVDVDTPIEMLESRVSTDTVIRGETRVFRFRWSNRGNHPVQHGINASGYRNNLAGDTRENILNAFLGTSSSSQAGFIRPGEEGNAVVTLNAASAEPGDYDVNILFAPKFDVNRAMINDLEDDLNPVEDIYSTVELNVETTIIVR